jgi:hypothetical protein
MKVILLLAISMFSINIHAAQKMSADAVEIFQVLSHHQVVECMRDVPQMVNVSVEKVVARCPGCNTYTITGSEVGIDTPRREKTTITIKGRAVPGIFNRFIQLYTCDIKQ